MEYADKKMFKDVKSNQEMVIMQSIMEQAEDFYKIYVKKFCFSFSKYTEIHGENIEKKK